MLLGDEVTQYVVVQASDARGGVPHSNGLSRTGGLGAWRFDSKSRKRKYVDLTGKEHTGGDAFLAAIKDKELGAHPSQRARSDLKALMEAVNTNLQFDGSNDETLFSLTAWGMPPKMAARYAEKGVTRLFPWQVECVTAAGGSAQRGGNLIYSAPTSGGKTLVAEILMLRRLGLRGPGGRGCVLFVVPFIALAEEKCRWLRDMFQDIPLGVRAFHGESQGLGVTPDLDVGVCTIERANVILSQLIEAGDEDLLTMVVVDELHMLVDRSRGFLLEVLLSKVKFLLGNRVQLVGMSATLPQLSDLATWLDASNYTTKYRPVSLSVRVAKAGMLYARKIEDESLVPPATSTFDSVFELVDPSQSALPHSSVTATTTALCLQTLQRGKSVILFCPTKKSCEEMASHITAAIAADALGLDAGLATRRVLVLEELRQLPSSLCPILKATVPRGVSYHHAGMSIDERNIIQLAFANGALSVLCATSTLAAGVSLPAHRVIIRSTKMGVNQLTVETFRQMCGRAGRMGHDTDGEAILVIEKNSRDDERAAVMLMTQPQRPLLSELHQAHGGGLEKHLLELCLTVSREKKITGVAVPQYGCRSDQLQEFVSCTLLAVQQKKENVARWTSDALAFLNSHNFLTRIISEEAGWVGEQDKTTNSTALFMPTALARATVLSGMTPVDAVEALWPLQAACRRLILRSPLHLVFLATPPLNSLSVPWDRFADIFQQVAAQCPDAPLVAKILGVEQGRLERYRFAPPNRGCNNFTTRLDRRFFHALVLLALTLEWPLAKTEQLLGMQSGQFSALQTEATHFCKSAVMFCSELRWTHLAAALGTLATRLSYGVAEELLSLVRMGVSDMPGPRARVFFKAGLVTPQAIVEAGAIRVSEVLYAALPHQGSGGLPHSASGSLHVPGGADPALDRRSACASLAVRIVRRAVAFLNEELELQSALEMHFVHI